MVEMTDQSQQESRKRIVNFHDGKKENEKYFTCAFFKKAGFCKKHCLHIMRIEKQQRTKLDLEQSAPSPQRKVTSLVKSLEGDRSVAGRLV